MTASRYLASILSFKLNVIFIQMVQFREMKYWLKTFFKFKWCLGNAFCVVLHHSFLYLLHYIIEHAHKHIHHLFFWRKSAQDTGRFENSKSVQKKKMAYMILRVLLYKPQM